jgi:hypothetical protein
VESDSYDWKTRLRHVPPTKISETLWPQRASGVKDRRSNRSSCSPARTMRASRRVRTRQSKMASAIRLNMTRLEA